MAIPTLPGFKRRRGAGNEVAEFAKAFMQGYRIFNADQRRSGSRANDPYSDENLAKYDQRLGGNFMSKLFGSGDEVTGADRGALRLQAIMKAAEERGDVATWEKTRDSLYKLNELQKKGELLTPGGTSRDIVTPEKRAAVEVDAPVPVARPPEFAQNNEDYQPQQQTMAALDDSYAQPDLFEPEVFAARGGMIERPSITAGVAIPIDDEEEEKQAPSAPVGADLPDDPEALSDYAAEAIDAGYRKLSRDLAPGAAMPDEDPDYNARVEGYARGANRMSDAEVAALDAIVDPTGELPTATRSAARMAAIYKFYKDQGDDETAEDVAARLVQYNKFAGQTRAMLGMQAIEQGKVQEGVKLIADAYEQNVPDGKSVEATVNPDGSVNVAVGYMKRGEDGRLSLSPEISERIPLNQLPQFAFAVTKDGERVLMGSAAARAAAKKEGGGSGSPASTRQAVAAYDRAVQALRALPADATEEQREQAYQAALGAYRSAVDSFQVGKGKSKAYAAQQYGVQPPQRSGATSTGKGTAEERAAAADAAEKAKLDKRADDIAEDMDYRGAIRESEQDELAMRKRADVDMKRIALGAKNNPAEALKPKERKELYDGISTAADAALSAQFNLPDAETKDDKKVTLTKDQRAVIVDTAFDLARRNDMSEDQAVRAAMSMLRGSLRPDSDGMIQAGQFKVATAPQFVRALAGMRVGLQREIERASKPTASSSPAGQLAAGAARGVANAVSNLPNVGAGYTSPELATQAPSEPIRLMRDLAPEERPQQQAVALQNELRFLQNKVARRSGSAQELRAAQERIDELARTIEALVPQLEPQSAVPAPMSPLEQFRARVRNPVPRYAPLMNNRRALPE